MPADLLPPGRDYAQLLGAMNQLLAVLWNEGDEESALRASFEAAARGFGAQKALVLLVEEGEPVRLRAVHVVGKLGARQEALSARPRKEKPRARMGAGRGGKVAD